MHEALKQFSIEVAEKFSAALENNKVKEFIEETKAAKESDTGTFEVIISTDNQDRQGDVVDQKGWDLSHFKNNPVVLWGHDYCSLPIGVCDSVELENGQLVAKGRFAPAEANPFAQQVRKLYDMKIVRATSVGFIPKEVQGNVITKAELLEFSFVPVPANPYALSTAKAQELALDLDMIKAKGLEIKIEDEKPAATEGEEQAENAGAEEKNKGAVQDMINARENQTWDSIEQKYRYTDGVFGILGAFCSVYLDDRVPVDQFGPLLNETIAILQQYAADPTAPISESGEVSKALKEKEIDLLSILTKRKESAVSKAGRMISEKNRTLIQTSIDSLKETSAALEELLAASQQGDGEAQKTELSKQRSNNAESNEKGLDDFFLARQVLRQFSTNLSDVLAKFNERARTHKK